MRAAGGGEQTSSAAGRLVPLATREWPTSNRQRKAGIKKELKMNKFPLLTASMGEVRPVRQANWTPSCSWQLLHAVKGLLDAFVRESRSARVFGSIIAFAVYAKPGNQAL